MTALVLALLAAAASDPLRDSQTMFDEGDFEGALSLLDSAVRTAPNAPATGKLHLARARCLNALRRNTELEPAFELALNLDPSLTASADDSPGFRATFERLRARLAGTVLIESEPTGAAVRVDGALVGRAPVTQLLPVGKYRVSVLDAAGAEANAVEVLVTPRSEQKVSLKAAAAPVAAVEPTPPAVAQPGAAGDGRWPVVPTATVRGVVDPLAGVSSEYGVGVLGRWFVAELDGIAGGAAGVGLRAGGRVAFLEGLLAAQLTADGVVFVRSDAGAVAGGGATLAFCVRPVSFFDVALEGSARILQSSPHFRTTYGLVGLALRLRWPNRLSE